MKRILKWLETRFSRHSGVVAANARHTPVGARVTPTVSAQDAAVKKGLKSHNSTEAGEILQLRHPNQRQAQAANGPNGGEILLWRQS